MLMHTSTSIRNLPLTFPPMENTYTYIFSLTIALTMLFMHASTCLHTHKNLAAYHGSSGPPACYTRPLFATKCLNQHGCADRAPNCTRSCIMCLQVILCFSPAIRTFLTEPHGHWEHRNFSAARTLVSLYRRKMADPKN
jgi:hypothetical protein